ncbi:MAG: BT_3987 domain-containing protein [Candidatus Cryptobacteroides sp.]
MKRYIKLIFSSLLAIAFTAGCNDAEYGVAGVMAFLQESLGEQGIAGQVTSIPADGKKVSLTIALSDAVKEDVTFRFVVDEQALARFNKEQSGEYLLMDESIYNLGGEVTIKAGEYAAEPVEIAFSKIPDEIADSPYALPLTLEVVKGNVAVAPVTAKYVVAVPPVLVSELPQFVGCPVLKNDDFTAFYPQWTIECRFQMQNSANRNRFVFNNGHLSGRFEDPQQPENGHDAHSLVQFHVAPDKWINPELSFKSNKWQHLAVSYDGTAIIIYVNGAFAGTKEYPVENAGQFDFVHWFNEPSYWGSCKLLVTELRIWSVCRSQSQIQSNYKLVMPSAAGLEGYWRVNRATYDAEANIFEDLTGKGHPLTVGKQIYNWIPDISSEDTVTPWK